jgi:hypothetical protein
MSERLCILLVPSERPDDSIGTRDVAAVGHDDAVQSCEPGLPGPTLPMVKTIQDLLKHRGREVVYPVSLAKEVFGVSDGDLA